VPLCALFASLFSLSLIYISISSYVQKFFEISIRTNLQLLSSTSIFQLISGQSTDRSRTFPLPVSLREHRCGIHQCAINQSADILVPTPNLWTGIQGSSGVCDPLECAPSSHQILSASAHVRLSLFRSSTNGCNCGADRPEWVSSAIESIPRLVAAVVDANEGSKEGREVGRELADEN